MILNAAASDRSGNRARFVWPWLLLGAVAFYGSYLIGPDHFWLSFPLLVVAGAACTPRTARTSPTSPSSCRQRRRGAIALINSFGALGGFAGSYLVGWLNDAPARRRRRSC